MHVHEKLDNLYDYDALKSEPLLEDFKHFEFSQKKVLETKTDYLNVLLTSFVGHFWEMSELDSQALFENCRKNNTTVQGLLSVAKMILLINETINNIKDIDSFQVLNAIPCDMRYYFNLEGDDLIKG